MSSIGLFPNLKTQEDFPVKDSLLQNLDWCPQNLRDYHIKVGDIKDTLIDIIRLIREIDFYLLNYFIEIFVNLIK